MMTMTKFKPQWRKTRVTDPVRKQMDAAIEQLNAASDDRFQIVTHLFGKQFICKLGSVTLFTAGTSSRPSTVIPIAICEESPDWVAFPLNSTDDFSDLCNRADVEDESERTVLLDFLTPRSKKM